MTSGEAIGERGVNVVDDAAAAREALGDLANLIGASIQPISGGALRGPGRERR
jgi:hypothetical protein